MGTPDYAWACLICTHVNSPGECTCSECHSPAQLSAADIARIRSGVPVAMNADRSASLSIPAAARLRLLGRGAASVAVLLSACTSLIAAGGPVALVEGLDVLALLFQLWILVPPMLPLLALRLAGRSFMLVGAVLASFACCGLSALYVDQFIHPDAQAALIFIFVPALQLFATGLPVGVGVLVAPVVSRFVRARPDAK